MDGFPVTVMTLVSEEVDRKPVMIMMTDTSSPCVMSSAEGVSMTVVMNVTTAGVVNPGVMYLLEDVFMTMMIGVTIAGLISTISHGNFALHCLSAKPN